jgi:hypothetical protein
LSSATRQIRNYEIAAALFQTEGAKDRQCLFDSALISFELRPFQGVLVHPIFTADGAGSQSLPTGISFSIEAKSLVADLAD